MLRAFRLPCKLCALLIFSASSIAYAEESGGATDEIFSLFEMVCFENKDNLSRVSDLALSEQWDIFDPTRMPGKDAILAKRGQNPRLVSTERSSAWSTKIAGNEIIVAVTKPRRLERPKCEIVAVGEQSQSPLDEKLVGERILVLGGKRSFDESERQPPVTFPNRVSRTYFSRDTIRNAAGRREPAAAISYLIETEENRVLHTITLYGERMQ